MTAKQLWKYLKAPLIVLGSLAVGNASTIFEAFRFYDTKPSALVGYIHEPNAEVKVFLNNGAEGQVADINNGFFRFDNISRGTHNLRFASSKYHSYSQPVEVADPGQCVLPTKINLTPRNLGLAERSGPKIIAVAVNYSADASEPLEGVTPYSTAGVASKGVLAAVRESDEDFWLYVDEDPDGALTFDKARAGLLGATGRVEEPVVIRSSAPVRDFRISGYRLGVPTGRLEPGQQIVVKDTATPRGSDKLWVKATVVREER